MATAILGALLLHCASHAAAGAASPRQRAAELLALPPADAALALPVKRLPDLARPDRTPRLLGTGRVEAARLATRTPVTGVSLRAAPATPHRARSHALRLRLRPPDDPLQAPVRT